MKGGINAEHGTTHHLHGWAEQTNGTRMFSLEKQHPVFCHRVYLGDVILGDFQLGGTRGFRPYLWLEAFRFKRATSGAAG